MKRRRLEDGSQEDCVIEEQKLFSYDVSSSIRKHETFMMDVHGHYQKNISARETDRGARIAVGSIDLFVADNLADRTENKAL